jgi:hypothetical protein
MHSITVFEINILNLLAIRASNFVEVTSPKLTLLARINLSNFDAFSSFEIVNKRNKKESNPRLVLYFIYLHFLQLNMLVDLTNVFSFLCFEKLTRTA